MKKEPTRLAEQIGHNLRALRKSSRYTLKKLSEKAGLSIALISRIENGQLSPSIKTLEKIATALGVRVSDILRNESMPDELKLAIASKVKYRMDLLGFSVDDLCRQSGLSILMLKRFLNHEIMLSIEDLIEIASVFKVDLKYFFKDSNNSKFSISRKKNRSVQGWMGKKQSPMYQVEVLFDHSQGFLMEPVVSTHVGKEEDLSKASHPGEEFVYVLEGTIKLFLDEKVVILNPGDAVYFDSVMSHAGVSIGDIPAKTLHTHFSAHSRIRKKPS
jgi:transcriptional regulator with XRE-family HTH domain/mannose-6-phosphate isomerase-like protein (cupin superfamily)